ncbi:MAG: AI-2E family transporter [Defluviitaleaceae bacterium]|nr:AI-2E family transporter [Defluviitaleaceae bacterium]
MHNAIKFNRFRALFPYFLLAVAIIAVYRVSGEFNLFWEVWRVASPFFYGFLLAYIINIPSSCIQRWLAKSSNKFIIKNRKLLGILIVLLILTAIIVASIGLVVPSIRRSMSLFIDNIPVYRENILTFINYINNLGLMGWHISEERVFDQLGNMFGDFTVEDFLQPLKNIGASIIAGLVAFISSIYVLLEKDRLISLTRKLLRIFASESISLLVNEVLIRLNRYIRLYIRTQTVDGVIVSLLTFVALFVMGSPYALVLALVLFILNYIPFLGSIVGTILAIIIVAFTQGATIGAISFASLLIIQILDVNIIQPKLMSDSFKISPYLVIVSITIGGAIAGVLGMLVAIPIVAVLIDMFNSFVDYYEHMKVEKEECK